MQDFADMAEGHEWTMRRLREMAGRLTEQAYLRASQAAAERDDEAHARWMLVFDRMARGLRLSIALEARLARERRRDADETLRAASGERHEPRGPRRAAAPGAAEPSDCKPREADREREDDDDHLPADAPLARRIGRLKSIIAGTDGSAPAPRVPASRAGRFRWVDGPLAPAESTGVPTGVELAEAEDAPWRGSG